MWENDFWYKGLKIILYGLLLTPLWVWSIFLFPFITTKILYFRLLVEALLVIYVILAIKYPELRPRWNWLLKSVWIYMGIVIVTSIFGINFGHSFWGTIERGEGIITMLHFAAYFTILASALRSRGDWYKYLLFSVGVSSYAMLYALFQFGCIDKITGEASTTAVCGLFLQTTGARVSGTVGNAAFFAAYVLFGIFLTFYLWLQAKRQESAKFSFGAALTAAFVIGLSNFLEGSFNSGPAAQAFFTHFILALLAFGLLFKFTRPSLVLFGLVGLFVLYNTQTRGALIAFAFALFLYGVFLAFKGKSSRQRIAAVSLIAIILLTGIGLYFGKNLDFVQSNATLRRLSTISFSDITTQSRLDTWQASWLGFKDRMFTGYGYENYQIAFNQYFPPRIFKDAGSQVWFDRAHNVVFDVALTSGIFGLLAYLAIFAAAFWALFKLIRKSDLDARFPVILTVLLLAYFLQNLFVFDTHATYLMFFLILAYISFLYERHFQISDSDPNPRAKKFQPVPVGFFLPTILAVLLILTAYFVNIEPAVANRQATNGIRFTKMRDYRQVESAFKKSLRHGTYMDQEIRQRLADNVGEAVNSGLLSPQEQSDLVGFMLDELRQSLKEYPMDAKNHLYLMNVLNRFRPGSGSDEVLRLGQEVIELSPTRQQIYFELGQAAFYKNDFEQGLAYFQEAVRLNPDTRESRVNFLLAGIIANRQDIVQRELQAITEELGYGFTAADYSAMARAYGQAGNDQKVIENYERAVAASPSNIELRVQLALAYGEVCDVEKARDAIMRVIEMDKSFAVNGQTFLNELETQCEL